VRGTAGAAELTGRSAGRTPMPSTRGWVHTTAAGRADWSAGRAKAGPAPREHTVAAMAAERVSCDEVNMRSSVRAARSVAVTRV
jgi:hypothetical protein